jgi:hypothetical protein
MFLVWFSDIWFFSFPNWDLNHDTICMHNGFAVLPIFLQAFSVKQDDHLILLFYLYV